MYFSEKVGASKPIITHYASLTVKLNSLRKKPLNQQILKTDCFMNKQYEGFSVKKSPFVTKSDSNKFVIGALEEEYFMWKL